MKNTEIMNRSLLNEMIEKKYVKVQKHPEADLFIYNYTDMAQYDWVWNEVTMMCRGLILDKEDTVVARPFQKFFNFGDHGHIDIPNESFEVYEKMDGSMGILYWLNDQPLIASRGSFSSEQAIKGTEMLYNQYQQVFPHLNKDKTYIFEIIYPENRIVVDYGRREELVLLAIIDTETGIDEVLKDIGFPLVKHYNGITDIRTLKIENEYNREGYVVKFKGGLRYKIKFDEYMRVHRIVTQVSSIDIWEYLKNGDSFEDVLHKVPDEFYQWVKNTRADLLRKYEAIEQQCLKDYKEFETRKEAALYFQTCAYPSILFSMLDKRPYDQDIWKRIRPVFQKPFKEDVE